MAGAILAIPITAVLRIIVQSVDHPYAHIICSVMEGRLSAATAEIGEALDVSASGAGLGDYGGAADEALEQGREFALSSFSDADDSPAPPTPAPPHLGGSGALLGSAALGSGAGRGSASALTTTGGWRDKRLQGVDAAELSLGELARADGGKGISPVTVGGL